MDWEAWLRRAVQPSSDAEEARRERTEKEIRDALSSYKPLQGRPYRVYSKGSYANNTNVRLNYDVDIAVEYHGYFYYDFCFDMTDQPKSVAGLVDSKDPYTRAEFKADIKSALVIAYGSGAISEGSIAYRVRDSKTTLPVDVVPCWDYRRYDHIVNGVASYHEGSCVYPTGGAKITNYPEQQLKNGNDKNNRTSRRYKRMVRALKRLQTKLVEDGKLATGLPSYCIECLVYNVPDNYFGASAYWSDMQMVTASLINSTGAVGNWNDQLEVNELKYLYRGHDKWTPQQVNALAHAVWRELGFS